MRWSAGFQGVILEVMSDSAKELYKLAHQRHHNEGDLEAASVLYERICIKYPDSPEARYARGQRENIPEDRRRSAPQEHTVEFMREFFECQVCGHDRCEVKMVNLSGGGGYRDSGMGTYAAITCLGCARAELFDLTVLEQIRARHEGR